jgi:hypothetical protein
VLAQQLLLYERVFIPTNDFGIVPALVRWLGAGLLEEMLSSGALGFLRRRQFLGYVGGGHGIKDFSIGPREPDYSDFNWMQTTMFRESPLSLDAQLANQCKQLSTSERSRLLTSILRVTQEVTYEHDFFVERVENDAYQFIQRSPDLIKFVLLKQGVRNLDLRRMGKIGGDQLRVSTRRPIDDGIDLVLRIAEFNLELVMASLVGNAQLSASPDAPSILKDKFQQAGAPAEQANALVKFAEVTNLPDLKAAVAEKAVTFQQFWELRQHREAEQFRKWVHLKLSADEGSLVRELISSLRSQPALSSMKAKVLRFAVTNAVGPLLGGLVNLGMNIADSFFVERWTAGYSPRFLLDRVDRLLPKEPRRKAAR